MKKLLAFILIIISFSILLGCSSCNVVNQKSKRKTVNEKNCETVGDLLIKAGAFNLSDYAQEVSDFPYSIQLASITNAEDAVEQAKILWIEEYGEDILNFIISFHAYIDSSKECWYVSGVLKPDMLGVEPHAIIEANGNVLAVWLD